MSVCYVSHASSHLVIEDQLRSVRWRVIISFSMAFPNDCAETGGFFCLEWVCSGCSRVHGFVDGKYPSLK